MVQILPFVGWRYDLSQVGTLADVTVPSAGSVDEDQQRLLYRKHPCNAIRLVQNRDEPGDTSPSDAVGRASDFWRLWKREHILLREHNRAFYILQTTFPNTRQGGPEMVRWSVIARLQLPTSELNENIYCVARAEPQEVARALELRKTCMADFSPVFGLLEDTTGEDSDSRRLSDHFEAAVRLQTPVECIEDTGVRHRMWPLTDEATRTVLETRLSMFAVRIFAGAASYEAAVQHRDQLTAEGQMPDRNSAIQTVLACLIPADDEGLLFSPQNVCLSGCTLTGADVIALLEKDFSCQLIGNETTAGEDALELARLNDQQPCLAVGTADGFWMTACSLPGDVISIDELIMRISQRLQSEIACSQEAGNSFGVRIVVPSLAPSQLFEVPGAVASLDSARLRINPDVPSGLVYSALDT